MTPKQTNYKNLAGTIMEQFKKRGMEGYYCEDKEEARKLAASFLTSGCSVSFGGSQTLAEIGLIQDLKSSDYVLYDRMTAVTSEEKSEMYSKIVGVDYYYSSSNAITMDGQLVNIDGIGNRVACLITGPKNVIIVAGMNKIVPDVDTGIERVQNIAAPPNAVRLGAQTPCAKAGRCCNCLTDDCMCCDIVITRKSRVKDRIKVILVGEELGY